MRIHIFILIFILLAGKSFGQINVTIDCSSPPMDMKHLTGFLGGKNDTAVHLWINPVADTLLLKTNPKFWRTGKTDNLPFVESRSMKSMLIISDMYAIYKGVFPNIPMAQPWLDWADYEWYVDTLVRITQLYNVTPEYFDVWNEPDHNWSGTYPQLIELYQRTINVIKNIDSTLKVTGPSFSVFYNGAAILPIIDTLNYLGVHFDAVNWHEFFYPLNAKNNINRIKDSLNVRPYADSIKIQVTEYGFQDNFLIPGFSVGFFSVFEDTDVEWVNRACWPVSDGITSWNTCNIGWNGLFWHDGMSPLPLYWTHRAYAEMSGNKLSTFSSNDTTFSVLACNDVINQEIRVLTGRHKSNLWSSPAAPESVMLTVSNYPYLSNGTIPIIIQKIRGQNIYSPLSQPELISDGNATVTSGTIIITIPDYCDGDVYYIYLNPSLPILSTKPVNQYSNDSYLIYPNPTNGELSIDLGLTQNEVSVIVRNELGQEIMTKSFNGTRLLQLNIPGESGIYFIEVMAAYKRTTMRVIKE